MTLKLFNSLSRSKEDFVPLHKNEVGLYTCGPTVYGAPHIGNMRTYFFEDILKRTLLANNYKIKHVMNITDVGHLTSDADEGEDKMEKGARREGKSVWEIAEEYTKMFQRNLQELNILEPNIWCKATDHIKEQIELIQKLQDKGYAYQISDGIYFDTSKFRDYGKIARLDIQGQKEGARVEANLEKRNSTDFALWKFSHTNGRSFDSAQDDATKRRQMEWPSPWGVGFPGWHIECSAMSLKYLGDAYDPNGIFYGERSRTIDIHCGGIDHLPVHHPNEIAQSEAATGQSFVKYWLHGEFMVIDEKRMGKSEDNFITLDSLKEKNITPLAYRYFCLGTHYRKPLNFSWEALLGSAKALLNLQNKVATISKAGKINTSFEQRFMEAMNDDLNTPQALAIMWELLKEEEQDAVKKQTLFKFDEILGLGLKNIKPLAVPKEITNLVKEREQARQEKNWGKADSLRQQILEQGFAVDDTEFGPVVKSK
jgi:cysteinyl-tRNA synthetase